MFVWWTPLTVILGTLKFRQSFDVSTGVNTRTRIRTYLYIIYMYFKHRALWITFCKYVIFKVNVDEKCREFFLYRIDFVWVLKLYLIIL